jgi:uncharacterized protein (TIGR03083 family)
VTKPTILEVSRIPPLTHAEAEQMARTELVHLVELFKSLSSADWGKPTDCTLWNVRQILAHQAGAYAGFASWGQFIRQWSQLSKRPQPGQYTVDLINKRQVEDRAHLSPSKLIAELEKKGAKAITTRQRLPGFLRAVPVPFGPPLGTARLDYLTDLIYTRDTWSHRLDICRATGRDMLLRPEHDGRIIALVMRDLMRKFHKEFGEKFNAISIVYQLTGPAGGCWRIGLVEKTTTTIHMDALDFSRLTSGRLKPDEVLNESLAVIENDLGMARWVLNHSAVPY